MHTLGGAPFQVSYRYSGGIRVSSPYMWVNLPGLVGLNLPGLVGLNLPGLVGIKLPVTG